MPWTSDDERLRALLAPLDEALRAADARFPVPIRPPLALGTVPGWFSVEDGRIVLSERLVADGTHAPGEPEGPRALDRWRRALASVLEATVHAAMGEGNGPAWARAGLAVHVADACCPDLGLADDALAAARTGDLGAHPRAGVAVLRAWQAQGLDPWSQAWAVWTGQLAEDDLMEALISAAGRVLGPSGVGPVADVARPAPHDVPTTLGPWTLARVEVAAHPRGGRVVVEGEGRCAPAWAPADRPLSGVAVSGAAGCRLLASAGGPVGSWEVRSAGGWGRILGARGVGFVFRPTGRFEVVLADAFVGGPEDLTVAERVGTSGVTTGRWRVDGPHRLTLYGLSADGVTLHGRGGSSPEFAVPGAGGGLGAGVAMLDGSTWTWTPTDDGRMRFDGHLGGATVEMVLAPTDGGSRA